MVVAEKPTKDLLTASKIGRYAINPYVGCPHACKYCYASFMKRFTNHPEAWGEFLDVKRCDKPIDLRKIAGKNVFMSTATDCYNPYEAQYGLTRSILERLVASAWCDAHGINYSAYFHHEEVIKTEVGKILGKNQSYKNEKG